MTEAAAAAATPEAGEAATAPTALEGVTPPEGTALEAAGTPPEPGAPVEIPDKFKNEDGTLNNDGILKSYAELEGKMGGAGAPPESADKYDVKLDFPDGTKIDEEGQKSFYEACHKAGMTNDQLQLVMNEAGNLFAQASEAKELSAAEVVAELKEGFGAEYGDKMISAMNAFNASKASKEDLAIVGNSPAAIRVLAALGANLSEDLLPRGEAPGQGMTEEALVELMNSDAYLKEKDPGHKIAVEKVQAHFRRKHPKKK